jgi:phosphonoacetate hydrolase
MRKSSESLHSSRKAFLICIDGCDPDYIRRSSVPNLRRLAREGTYIEHGNAMVPTVTNVNNVSLITGVYPEAHGITSNCYYDRDSGKEVYMESTEFIKVETVFEKISKLGLKTSLLTSKEKLLTLLRRGADTMLSAENPPQWLVDEVGVPPNIYSSEVNVWLFKALSSVVKKFEPNFVYLATTDYIMHKHPPEDAEAQEHMTAIDAGIGRLMDAFPGALFCVTADHGMNEKREVVNLEAVLKNNGVSSVVIPTVKDRYVPHHSNLSGSAYVYLLNRQDQMRAGKILQEAEGVEEVLTNVEAAKYHLPVGNTGDFFVLGEGDYVFGRMDDDERKRIDQLRSHGSLHEREIPIFCGKIIEKRIIENRGLTALILDCLSES